LLAYDAWLQSKKKFALYYFEVDQGAQTQIFHPTHYVNISQTLSRKQAACFAHASQQPESGFWPQHQRMQRFRGIECGVENAEGFVRHSQNLEAVIPNKG
jgi:N-acetylglucosamine malate deacetylase 1